MEELEYFISANAEESKLLSWVAICRRYTFIRDFMAEVVREHYLIGTPEITYTDYASFVSVKSQFHPELANLSEKTSAKIRQMLFNMMAEVGIVEQKTHIVPTLLPPSLLNLLPREDTLSFPMFVREN